MSCHVYVDCAIPTTTGSDKDFSKDFTQHLVDKTGAVNDTIASVTWTICPDDGVELHSETIDGNVATVWVRNTSAGQFYYLYPTLTTGLGRVIEDPPIGIASKEYSC